MESAARLDEDILQSVVQLRASTALGDYSELEEQVLEVKSSVLKRGYTYGDGLTAADCGKMGYKSITFPVSCLFAQTAALLDLLHYMKEHETDEGYPGRTMEFADYLKFIGVDRFREMWDKYVKE